MKLEIVDPRTDPRWDEFIGSFSDAPFFLTSNWARVLIETYDFKPLYFCFVKDDLLQAAMPVMEVKTLFGVRKGISLPFSDFCIPTLNAGDAYWDFYARIVEYGRSAGWNSFEVRGGDAPVREACPSEIVIGHFLSLLKDENDFFSRFKETTRRNIRRSIKSGVKVDITSSFAALRDFYQLHCMTRKRHGLPPPPFRFFEKIYEHLIAPGLGFIALGSWNGKTIAGAVFLTCGEKALYKYGASDVSYQHLRANNAVLWEAMRYLIKRGSSILFFGRTEPHHEGLRRFKMGWNGSEYAIQYFTFNFSKQAFVTAKSRTDGPHTKIFKLLPLPVLKAVGTIAYRFGA